MSELEFASIEWTCSACPVQAEGRLSDGRWFYFRARHEAATLSAADTLDDAIEDPQTRVRIEGWPEYGAGHIGIPEAAALADRMVGLLRPKPESDEDGAA